LSLPSAFAQKPLITYNKPSVNIHFTAFWPTSRMSNERDLKRVRVLLMSEHVVLQLSNGTTCSFPYVTMITLGLSRLKRASQAGQVEISLRKKG
jgi:hypothetical protein